MSDKLFYKIDSKLNCSVLDNNAKYTAETLPIILNNSNRRCLVLRKGTPESYENMIHKYIQYEENLQTSFVMNLYIQNNFLYSNGAYLKGDISFKLAGDIDFVTKDYDSTTLQSVELYSDQEIYLYASTMIYNNSTTYSSYKLLTIPPYTNLLGSTYSFDYYSNKYRFPYDSNLYIKTENDNKPLKFSYSLEFNNGTYKKESDWIKLGNIENQKLDVWTVNKTYKTTTKTIVSTGAITTTLSQPHQLY